MRPADIALVHGGQETIGADGRRLPGSGIARNALTIAMREPEQYALFLGEPRWASWTRVGHAAAGP
jgi:hypothetical protein